MYKEILVPVDLDNEASWKSALAHAVELGQTFGARLHALAVVPDFGLSMVAQYFPQDYAQQIEQQALARLHEVTQARVPEGVAVQHIVGHGKVADEILRFGRETGCDLICMGSHKPDFQDYLLGENAARVVRHADRSVLVVRD